MKLQEKYHVNFFYKHNMRRFSVFYHTRYENHGENFCLFPSRAALRACALRQRTRGGQSGGRVFPEGRADVSPAFFRTERKAGQASFPAGLSAFSRGLP